MSPARPLRNTLFPVSAAAWLGCCLLFFGGVSPAAEPLTGIILPVQDADLSFAVLGIVAEVKVREGEKVQAGQVLVRLDDQLESLEVRKAESVLEQARFEHEAAAKLIAEDIGTRADALAKRITFELAGNALETARTKQRQRSMSCPFDGVVVRVNKEQGESVLLNEVVARVVNMDRVHAQFYMKPEEAAALRKGDDYRMRLVAGASAGKIFTGKVTLVDPVLDAESALVRVRVEVPNAGNELRAGMRVEGGVAAPSS